MKNAIVFALLLGLTIISGGHFAVVAEEVVTDEDSVEIRICGRVINSDEKPVSGAIVYIRGNPNDPFTTGDDGRFEFTVNEKKHSLVSRGATFYAEVPDTDLIGKGYKGHDDPFFAPGMNPDDEAVIKIEHGRHFFGIVMDENGDPVEGALVGTACATNAIEPVLSGKDGRFSFHFFQNLTATELFAYKKEYGFDFVTPEPPGAWRERDLAQKNGPYMLVLSKDEPVKIHIEDIQGNPLEGVVIKPRYMNKKSGELLRFFDGNLETNAAMKDNLFRATTDKDGNAVIDWLPKNLVVSNDSENNPPRSSVNTSFAVNGNVSGRGIFRDLRGYYYESRNVPLEPDKKEYSVKLAHLAPVTGIVLDQQGEPCFAAVVKIMYPDKRPAPPGLQSSFSVTSRITNRAGEFLYLAEPNQTLTLNIESSQGIAPTITVEVGQLNETPPKKIEVVLERGTRLFGKVIETAPGKKLADSGCILGVASGEFSPGGESGDGIPALGEDGKGRQI